MKDIEGMAHLHVAVANGDQLRGVYGVLASRAALAAALAVLDGVSAPAPISAPKKSADADKPAAAAEPAAAEEASGEDVVLDTDGHPWSAELHAGTKGRNADGRWKMKVGVKRPDPAPGYPLADAGNGATGTKAAGQAPDAGASAPTADAGPATDDEEDEFAAFATSKPDTAPAWPRARWADADLSALCNQAAQALGGPAKVKETIAEFLPEGATNHSRNIPAEMREEFAVKLESVAGIEFAG